MFKKFAWKISTLRETKFQNIVHGFLKHIRKYCLNMRPWILSQISGRKISKSFRTSHVQKVFMEIFQTFQETKFQNIIHEVMFEHVPVDCHKYQDVKFQSLTHGTFSEISGHHMFKTFSRNIFNNWGKNQNLSHGTLPKYQEVKSA